MSGKATEITERTEFISLNSKNSVPSVAPACQTCLERGRVRPGTHFVGPSTDAQGNPSAVLGIGWMCDPCFRGEAFCKQERLGDPVGLRRITNDRRYYLRHREKKIAATLRAYRRRVP